MDSERGPERQRGKRTESFLFLIRLRASRIPASGSEPAPSSPMLPAFQPSFPPAWGPCLFLSLLKTHSLKPHSVSHAFVTISLQSIASYLGFVHTAALVALAPLRSVVGFCSNNSGGSQKTNPFIRTFQRPQPIVSPAEIHRHHSPLCCCTAN
ncbi:hypothetical protein HDV57DRAFT_453225 [Trichoderma longibrachiatum]